MFGFGYVFILVYCKICEVIGVNFFIFKDVMVEVLVNMQIDKMCIIIVEFDGNVQGLWCFCLMVVSMQVYFGEMMQVIYEVVNIQLCNVDVQVILSYVLLQLVVFFKKVECFCFMQQILGLNQVKQMLVVFYIDFKLFKEVIMIMLFYIFFEINGKVKMVG